MLVVADTTPPLYLARLGLLELLRELYGTVIVPTAVWHELTVARPDAPGASEVRAASWIVVDPGADTSPLLVELQDEIDRGEAAAIALALLREADLLLVDDGAGRRVAAQRGLLPRGTVGVLVAARQRGLIPALRPVLDALVAEEFRIDAELVRRVLLLVDEASD